jgi:hypothetical protein
MASTGIIFKIAASLTAFAMILIQPLESEELLLSSQQPYDLSGNVTLVIEDVNPKSGVVWLKLFDGNQTVSSAVLGIGGHLNHSNINHSNISLKVSRIYAGGVRDLVALDLYISKTAEGNATSYVSLNASRNATMVYQGSTS